MQQKLEFSTKRFAMIHRVIFNSYTKSELSFEEYRRNVSTDYVITATVV